MTVLSLSLHSSRQPRPGGSGIFTDGAKKCDLFRTNLGTAFRVLSHQ